jgi:hypothetical protein
MTELDDAQLLTVVQNLVEKHGCKLANIDFENASINIEGPDDAKANCARALIEVLG